MDATVRIWDIISAKPLDAMQLDTAVTALSLSSNMDMLATSHVNHNGVYLWANQLMYSDVVDYGCVGSGKTIMDVSMPTLSTNSAETRLEPESIQLSTAVAEDNRCVMNGPEIMSKDQITPELVTLALLPKAQLQGLINLDTIKVCLCHTTIACIIILMFMLDIWGFMFLLQGKEQAIYGDHY